MIKLNPGNLAARLARVNTSTRSSRWRKAARKHLLKDAAAKAVRGHALKVYGGFVCEKKAFPTEAAAQHALDASAASTNPQRRETRFYCCNYCDQYHLTSIEVPRHGNPKENVRQEQRQKHQRQPETS